MARRTLSLAVLAVAGTVAAVAPAQDDYRYAYGRIRQVEPGVSVQRASETEAEEAVPNMPFLPGDRIWTDDRGRLEAQFGDGTFVRIDSRSKLDYGGRDERRRESRVVLTLWSGALYVHQLSARNAAGLIVETPSGIVETRTRGVYRVDVQGGEAQLAVYEGEATLEGQRARAGERLLARGGQVDGRPERFDRSEGDEFARWDDQRQEEGAFAAANRPEYVPEEVAPYMGDLANAGGWYYEPEVGHVWRPYVAPGWRPYMSGRWVWTAFGWTWVPSERWGWAPFHYGRWGNSAALGWYWIPGASWGPAWVSWATGGDYVGWCPLGYRDRPVVIVERGDRGRFDRGGFDRGRERGNAVPRGTQVSTDSSPWVFARRGDLRAREVTSHLISRPRLPEGLKVVESPVTARLTRDLTIAEPGTVAPRNVRTKPGPGDTVPELRTDPMTTIPAPVARRRYDSERERGEDRRLPSSGIVIGRPAPEQARRSAPETAAPGSTAVPMSAAPAGEAAGGVPLNPTARPRDEAGRPVEAHPVEPRPIETRPIEPRRNDGDRDVLRPIFKPLSHPRPESSGREGSRGEGASGRNDGGARNDGGSRRNDGGGRMEGSSGGVRPEGAVVHSKPAERTPPPTQSSAPAREGAHARAKDKDKDKDKN